MASIEYNLSVVLVHAVVYYIRKARHWDPPSPLSGASGIEGEAYELNCFGATGGILFTTLNSISVSVSHHKLPFIIVQIPLHAEFVINNKLSTARLIVTQCIHTCTTTLQVRVPSV